MELDYGWGVTSSAIIIELIPEQKLVTEDEHGEQAIWILTQLVQHHGVCRCGKFAS